MPEMSLTEMLAQRAQLEQKIQETMRAERSQAIAQIRSIAGQYGLTATDIARTLSGRGTVGPKTDRPAMFRDPATGNTWGGRGKRPAWLNEALAAGKTLGDFSIVGQAAATTPAAVAQEAASKRAPAKKAPAKKAGKK